MNFTVASHNEASNPKDFVHYDNVEFSDIPEMVTSGYAYSAGAFKNNHRKIDNWIGLEDVLILDIDDGCTIQQALSVFSKYECYVITSRSHQKDKHGLVCDRFRVFIKLENTISDAELREKFISNIMSRLPFIDTKCKDSSRFYFSSPSDAEVHYISGKPMKIITLSEVEATKAIEPIAEVRLDEIFFYSELKECWINKYGEILVSENNGELNKDTKLKGALTILNNEFYSGNRNHCLFKIACLLAKDGLDEDEIADFLIKENSSRDGIKLNELMQCLRSAFRTI